MQNKALFDLMKSEVAAIGTYKVNVIPTADIETDRSFRDMCASNSCGVYGKCWMCPPDVGDIDELMAQVTKYQYALVYQTVSDLEDSYDFEGMIDAKKQSYVIAGKVRDFVNGLKLKDVLHLGAGGCGVCEVCAKRTNEPCRFPYLAMPSLEAYGINVSRLAAAADMKYINGENTVTYFGAVLFSVDGEN